MTDGRTDRRTEDIAITSTLFQKSVGIKIKMFLLSLDVILIVILSFKMPTIV